MNSDLMCRRIAFRPLRRMVPLLAGLVCLPAALGQEAPPSFELAPFAVSVEGGHSVLVISERDLAQRQATDLEDALSLDPAISVGGSTAIAQKIYVRNLGEGLINVSVDGATQSGSLFHHTGRMLIEPELLKRVEVQPGIGSAADGPGALGGAIRFITVDPEDLLQAGREFGGRARYSYFSNTRGHKGSVTGFGRVYRDWSALLSYVVADHDTIEDGAGNRLAGSGSRQEVALAKVVGHFGNGQTLRLSFETLEEAGAKLRRPEWAPGPGNPLFPMDASRKTAVLGYEWAPSDAGWLNLGLTTSYSTADIFQDGPFGPYSGEIEATQFDLRNHTEFGAHRLVYGIDHRRDEVGAGPVEAPSSFQENGRVTGLFLQNVYQATDQLEVSAGARADFHRLRDRQGQPFESEGVSPNLGISYDLTPELTLVGSAATAYRGPGIHDAFRIDRAENDADLKAEKARNLEARLVYARGGFLLEGGVYRSRIRDVITNTLPWSVLYVNAGDLDTDGVFMRATYGNERFNLSLQYNHADTTLNGQTATRYQYSSLVSRIGDTWVADAAWRPLAGLEVGWYVRLVEGLDNILVPESISELPDTWIDKPGYVTHDFYLRWQPSFAAYLSFQLTIKNIFDKHYLSHASVEDLTGIPGFAGVVGAPEQGRDIRLSASLRF